MYVSSNHIIYELETTSFSSRIRHVIIYVSVYLFDLDQDLEFCITDGDIFHFVDKDALDVV